MLQQRTRAASFVRSLVVLALAACSTSGSSDKAPRSLTRETLPSLKDTFNAGADRPRAIIFFSSGCAACDTGSAALEEMLEKFPTPITVIAVWEPVMATDPPPTRHMLGNLRDSRVHQVWDPNHIISDE